MLEPLYVKRNEDIKRSLGFGGVHDYIRITVAVLFFTIDMIGERAFDFEVAD